MANVDGIDASPERRHKRRQAAVHVETRRSAAPDGERVEEERVDGQGHPTRQKEGAVPPLHALAARVENAAGPTAAILDRDGGYQILLEVRARADWNERSSGAGFPLRLETAGLVAARGVERRHSRLSARVALRRR